MNVVIHAGPWRHVATNGVSIHVDRPLSREMVDLVVQVCDNEPEWVTSVEFVGEGPPIVTRLEVTGEGPVWSVEPRNDEPGTTVTPHGHTDR